MDKIKLASEIDRWAAETDDESLAEDMRATAKIIRAEVAKTYAERTSGKTVYDAIERIRKRGEEKHEGFSGAIFDRLHPEKWIVVDTYVAVRKSGAPIVRISEIQSKLTLDTFMSYDCPKIALPDIAELKLYCRERKYTAKNAWKAEPYFLDCVEEVCVNPMYLIDAMESLPGCVAVYNAKQKCVCFSAESGDGILMCMRPPKNN